MADKPPKPLVAPVTEIGTAAADGPVLGWWAPLEETPELVWPLSVKVYNRMRRQDAQVGSVLRAVSLPVLSTRWWVDPAGAREEVTQFVAGELGLPVKGEAEPKPVLRTRDRFSWSEHVRLALLCLPFGHMFFEQVYRVDDAGMARIRKLGPRLPRSIAEVKVAPDGGLVSITQDLPAGITGQARPIPVERLVAYVHDREGGDWLGSSVLRMAYKNWILKDRVLRTGTQTIDRNGMGVPVYEAAEGETDLAAGQAIARSVRSGDNAGAAIPHGASLDLLGVEGTLPDSMPHVRYHDEQIARAVLAHFLNLGTQTGSWALGSTFADFFINSLAAVAVLIRDTATAHIVEDLVDLNFGETEPAPRLAFDEIGNRQAATAAAMKLLRDAGLLTTDDELEQFVRTSYGLPAKPAGSQPAHDATEPQESP